MRSIAFVCVIFLCGFTEYELAVQSLPSDYLVGGCVDAGHNPGTAEQTQARTSMTSRYSWSIITEKAVDRVAKFASDGAVDFGAGNGYWSHLLRERGVDVLALDNWQDEPERTWTLVQTGDTESLAGTSARVLILSWPPRMSSMALDALNAWNGDRLVYAGEILRGTADPAFHQELAENWRLVERIDVPQWRNRSDAIFLFERDRGNGMGWDWILDAMKHCMKAGN